MTPLEIEKELNELTADTLPKLNEEIDKLSEQLERTNHAHQLASAKQLLQLKAKDSKLTVKELDAMIYVELEESTLETSLAQVKYKSLTKKINTVTMRIDVLRSMLSYKKAELERTTA